MKPAIRLAFTSYPQVKVSKSRQGPIEGGWGSQILSTPPAYNPGSYYPDGFFWDNNKLVGRYRVPKGPGFPHGENPQWECFYRHEWEPRDVAVSSFVVRRRVECVWTIVPGYPPELEPWTEEIYSRLQ